MGRELPVCLGKIERQGQDQAGGEGPRHHAVTEGSSELGHVFPFQAESQFSLL